MRYIECTLRLFVSSLLCYVLHQCNIATIDGVISITKTTAVISCKKKMIKHNVLLSSKHIVACAMTCLKIKVRKTKKNIYTLLNILRY